MGTVSPETCRADPGVPGCPAYGDVDAALAAGPVHLVDVVSLCAPRARLVRGVGERGCDVLLGPEIARTMRDADGVLKAAKRCRVRVAVSQPWRFCPALAKVKEVVGSGVLGEGPRLRWCPRVIQACEDKHAVGDGGRPELAGLCRDMDVCNWLLGVPGGGHPLAGTGSTAGSFLQVDYASGARATTVYGEPDDLPGCALLVTGPNGCLSLDVSPAGAGLPAPWCLRLRVFGRERLLAFPSASAPMRAQAGYVVACLARGVPWSFLPLAEAQASLSMALAVLG